MTSIAVVALDLSGRKDDVSTLQTRVGSCEAFDKLLGARFFDAVVRLPQVTREQFLHAFSVKTSFADVFQQPSKTCQQSNSQLRLKTDSRFENAQSTVPLSMRPVRQYWQNWWQFLVRRLYPFEWTGSLRALTARSATDWLPTACPFVKESILLET